MSQAFDRCGVLDEAKLRSPLALQQWQEARASLLKLHRETALSEEEEPQVLFVKPRAIKCDQLCIDSATVAIDAESALLVVPLVCHSLDSFTLYYYVTRHQWLQCKQLGNGRRLLRLGDFLRIARPLGAPQQHTPLVIEMEVESCAERLVDEPVASNVAPRLSPNSAVTGDDDVLFQCGVLMDYILLRLLLPTESPRLDAKWLRHAKRVDPTVRRSASASLMAHYVSSKVTCDDAIVRQWVAMEGCLFVDAAVDATQFHAEVAHHLDTLPDPDVVALWQHAQWHSFTVASGRRLFWRTDAADRVSVSAHWLLVGEDLARCVHPPVRQGLVSLSGADFSAHFLPCLYRHLLLDLVHCWSYCAAGVALQGRLPRDTLEALVQLRVDRHSLEDVFEFNTSVLQWHTSPVMKHAYRHYGAKQLETLQGTEPPKKKWVPRLLSASVEMEDLFIDPAQYLPPCLSRLISFKRWYKHEDRVALVACLVDSGYKNGDRVVEMMCRNTNNTASNRQVIGRMFKDMTTKKWGKLEGKRVSRACDTIINSVYQQGNLLRCPFEEARNGEERRRDHTDDEKAEIRAECACSVDPQSQWPLYVFSPLDYISHKLTRRHRSATFIKEAPPK